MYKFILKIIYHYSSDLNVWAWNKLYATGKRTNNKFLQLLTKYAGQLNSWSWGKLYSGYAKRKAEANSGFYKD